MTMKRTLWIGVALLGGAVVALTPGIVSRQQTARAEQLRTRCVRSLAGAKSWQAKITHTERGTEGSTTVVTEELSVRRPGQYRLALHETDEKGRPVDSVTVRTPTAMYTRRVDADGSTELHVITGVRPTLGVWLDNELGQTISAVGDSEELAVVGTQMRNGHETDQLRLGPGHSVWVDKANGLPVAEQTKAGDTVVSEFAYSDIVTDPQLEDGLFDPGSLGAADTTVTEDLGFKPVSHRGQARSVLGFMPLDVPAPAGFALDVQGGIGPDAQNGEGSAEPAFVSMFSDGSHGVMVTQTSRPELDGVLPAEIPGEPDAARRIDVGGTPALFETTPNGNQLTTVRGDSLVTIEGDLAESDLTALAASIR